MPERIPTRGNALDELERLEASLRERRIEGYDEAARCALTCKTCKSASCDEVEQ